MRIIHSERLWLLAWLKLRPRSLSANVGRPGHALHGTVIGLGTIFMSDEAGTWARTAMVDVVIAMIAGDREPPPVQASTGEACGSRTQVRSSLKIRRCSWYGHYGGTQVPTFVQRPGTYHTTPTPQAHCTWCSTSWWRSIVVRTPVLAGELSLS